jgi:hypothetical protein
MTLGIIGWSFGSNSSSGRLLALGQGAVSILLVCVGAVASLFFFSLSFLLFVQTQNFCLNRTTNERFSHRNRAGINESVMELQHATSSGCENFSEMCLNRPTKLMQSTDKELEPSFHFSDLKRNFVALD